MEGMKALRLFIAIQLSDEMKKAFVACMHDLKKQGVEGNYVPAQNLHLTLAFIGEYVKELRGALRVSGIPFDEDKFVPHITLIRKAAAKKAYQVHLPKAEMTVKKVSLMKSEMKNGKMVYREM